MVTRSSVKSKLIVSVIGILMLSLTSCGISEKDEIATSLAQTKEVEPTSPPSTKSPYPIITITKETGLYKTAAADANQITTLPVGIKLKPAFDKTAFSCPSFSDSGMTFTMCHVTVISSGKTGWVLKKYTN